MFGLGGGGDIFKYDFLLLLIDTKLMTILQLSSLCKQWVELGGGGAMPPLNLKLGRGASHPPPPAHAPPTRYARNKLVSSYRAYGSMPESKTH